MINKYCFTLLVLIINISNGVSIAQTKLRFVFEKDRDGSFVFVNDSLRVYIDTPEPINKNRSERMILFGKKKFTIQYFKDVPVSIYFMGNLIGNLDNQNKAFTADSQRYQLQVLSTSRITYASNKNQSVDCSWEAKGDEMFVEVSASGNIPVTLLKEALICISLYEASTRIVWAKLKKKDKSREKPFESDYDRKKKERTITIAAVVAILGILTFIRNNSGD